MPLPDLRNSPKPGFHPSTRFAPWRIATLDAAQVRRWGDDPRELGRAASNVNRSTLPLTITKTGVANGLLIVRSATSNSGASNAGSGLTSVSDTRNGTWNASIFSNSRTSTWFVDIALFQPPAPLQVGDVVTFTYGGTNNDHAVVIEEIIGHDTLTPLDKTAAAGNLASALTSGTTATLTQAEELVYTAWAGGDDTAFNIDGGLGASMDSAGGAQRRPSLGSGDGAGTASVVSWAQFQYVHATTAQSPTGALTDKTTLLPSSRNWAGATVTIKKAAGAPPIANANPVATGTPQVGRAIASTVGSWDSATSFSYQWYRADDAGGTNEVAITGAQAQQYVPAAADVGKYVRCAVTGSNSFGLGLPAYSNYIGASLCTIASDGTATVPGAGIVASTSMVVRKLAEGRDTDHTFRTWPTVDSAGVGDSVFRIGAYSVNTNWTAAFSDAVGNTYAQHHQLSGATGNVTVDVWASLNIGFAMPTGTVMSETPGGSGAGGPSDSVLYELYAVTPPLGKTLALDSAAGYGDASTNINTAHTTTAITPSALTTFLWGVFGLTPVASPFWTPAAGWTEAADYGDTLDPAKNLAVQLQLVTTAASISASGTSTGSQSSQQFIIGYTITDSSGAVRDAVPKRHPSPAFRPWAHKLSNPVPQVASSGPQAIVPAAINATSSMSGAVVKLAAVQPAAINATSTLTGAVTKIVPIVPAAINATSTLTGVVTALHRVTPSAINATSTMSGSVTLPGGATVVYVVDQTPQIHAHHHI